MRVEFVAAACVLSGCIYGINPDYDPIGTSAETSGTASSMDESGSETAGSGDGDGDGDPGDGDGDPGDGDPGDGDPGDGDPGDGDPGDGDPGDGDGDGDGDPACLVNEADLVACYEYAQVDEGVVVDDSASGNHGVAVNVSLGPGVSGEGAVFDVDSTATIPHTASLQLDGPLTIETWLYIDELPPNSNRGVIEKSGEYRMTVEASGFVRCQFGDSTDMKMSVSLAQWQHLACVWSGTTILNYKNGQLAGGKDTNPGFTPIGAELVLANDAGLSKPLQGSLDVTAVWRVARSEAELCASAGPLCP